MSDQSDLDSKYFSKFRQCRVFWICFAALPFGRIIPSLFLLEGEK